MFDTQQNAANCSLTYFLKGYIIIKFDPVLLAEYNLKNKPFPPLVELFEYFADNMDFGKALMGSKGDISFLEKLRVAFTAEAKKWIKISRKNNNMIFDKYFVDYSVFGFIGIIKKWFESDMETPPKEMAVMAVKTIFNGLN